MITKSINFKFLVFTIIVFVNISCKSKDYVFPAEVETEVPQILVPPPALSKSVDDDTPLNVQPYIVNTGGQVIQNVITEKAPNGYNIIFSDEFNVQTLNASKWNVLTSPKSRSARTEKGISSWFWKPEQVSVNGTDLVLKAEKFSSNSMYCGGIDSR